MDRSTSTHNTQDPSSAKRTHAPVGKRRHVCKICKLSFVAKGHLNRHLVIHSGEQNHKCCICERSFSQRENLQRHLTTVHRGEKLHVCEICKRSFSSKAYLMKHVRVHRGENALCPICNKSLAWNLKRHLLTHSVEKPHVCNICNKSFTDKKDLKRHILIHNGEKPYVCNICSAAFPDERYLKRHIISHNGNKQHLTIYSREKVHVHNESLTDKSNQNKHSQIHNGDSPMSNISNKSPTLSVRLKRHSVIPMQERSIICRVCNKSFTRKHSLKKHLSFHCRQSCPNTKEDWSKVCCLCDKKFAEETCLKLHYLHSKGKHKQHSYACRSCLKEVLEKDKRKIFSVVSEKVSTVIREGSAITNLNYSADANEHYTENSRPEKNEIKEEDDDDIVKEEHDIDYDFEGFGSADDKESNT